MNSYKSVGFTTQVVFRRACSPSAGLRTRGEITAPPMHQNARQRLGTCLAVDSFIAPRALSAFGAPLRTALSSRANTARSAMDCRWSVRVLRHAQWLIPHNGYRRGAMHDLG
jgi:hypothetical protein